MRSTRMARLRSAVCAWLLAWPAVAAAETPPSLYPVMVGRAWGFMDRAGVLVLPARFAGAGRFSEGLAPAQVAGSWGFIDAAGRWAIAPRFQNAYPFSIGLAAVEIAGRWGYVDHAGQAVIALVYQKVSDFSDDGLACVISAGDSFFIDRSGRQRVSDGSSGCRWFHEGLAAVQSGAKWGFLRPDGTYAIAALFDGAAAFSEGLAGVKQGGHWGFIDRQGRWAIPPSFDRVYPFHEGLAGACLRRGCGYLDRAGGLAVPVRFDDVGRFRDGLAWVKLGLRGGYVDRAGLLVWDPLRGLARELAELGLLALSVILLPGLAARVLARRACGRILAAEPEQRLPIFHRLQARLATLIWGYILAYMGAAALVIHRREDTLAAMWFLCVRWGSGLGAAQVPTLIILCLALTLVPYYFGYILLTTAGYRADQLIRGTSWTMGEAVWANIRVIAIMMLPMVVWLLLVPLLPDNLWGIGLALAVFLLAIFTFTPLWLRWLWKSRPLPEGEVAAKLAELSSRTGVSFRGTWVWSTSRAKVANAMVSGLLPICRYVFLTDYALESLSPAEIAAVIGHEIGHIKRRHLWWYLAFSALYAGTRLVWFLVARRLAWVSHMPLALGYLGNGLWYLGYFVIIFGVLSRRFEYAADRYAAELTGDPEAMASALEKLAALNGTPRRWTRWQEALSTHPSFARRVQVLRAGREKA